MRPKVRKPTRTVEADTLREKECGAMPRFVREAFFIVGERFSGTPVEIENTVDGWRSAGGLRRAATVRVWRESDSAATSRGWSSAGRRQSYEQTCHENSG